jgi:acyl carrier protein
MSKPTSQHPGRMLAAAAIAALCGLALLTPPTASAADRACFPVVKKVLVEQLGVESEKVTLSANIVDDLGADKLDAVGIVMAVEQAFGTQVSDSAAKRLRTVGDIVNAMRARGLCR